jgi:glucosamine--fructose-6-phosphate aminotransferase (isomerizing)
MDGIFCYAGRHEAGPMLLQGLRRLELLGCDSAGLATVTDSGRLQVRRRAGRLADLREYLKRQPVWGHLGIAHLRRAARQPWDRDLAPQLSFDGKVAVVHDGVLENRTVLKRQVEQDGIRFRGRTDAEVVAQLLTCHLVDDLLAATCAVLPLLQGASVLAAVSSADPDRVIAASQGRPLLLGRGDGYTLLAGEAAVLAGLTKAILPLESNEVAELTADSWRILDPARLPVRRSVFQFC